MAWDESQHPRGPDGKFSAGSGAAGAGPKTGDATARIAAARVKAQAKAAAIVSAAKVKASQIKWKVDHDAAKKMAAIKAGRVHDPEAAKAAFADAQKAASAKAQAVIDKAKAKAKAIVDQSTPKPKPPLSSSPNTHENPAPSSQAHGAAAESPPIWEKKKNPKRVEAAKKAAAASVERRREIHSAVASNLPQELQTAWAKEGHKFMQQEAPRIRGVKDRINAASKISEAFTEQYGSGSETSRGYEGDRYHRRAEIEAAHAEAWADEQEKRYYEAAARAERYRQPAVTSRKSAQYDDEVPF